MNVGQLKEFLSGLDENMEILFHEYSDYSILKVDDLKVIKAVPKNFYVMRSHPTMSEENKVKEQEFLIFPGN